MHHAPETATLNSLVINKHCQQIISSWGLTTLLYSYIYIIYYTIQAQTSHLGQSCEL